MRQDQTKQTPKQKTVFGKKSNPLNRLLFSNNSGSHENEEDMENDYPHAGTPTETPQSILRTLLGNCKVSHFAFGAPRRLVR